VNSTENLRSRWLSNLPIQEVKRSPPEPQNWEGRLRKLTVKNKAVKAGHTLLEDAGSNAIL